jgi:hypothetical protein
MGLNQPDPGQISCHSPTPAYHRDSHLSAFAQRVEWDLASPSGHRMRALWLLATLSVLSSTGCCSDLGFLTKPFCLLPVPSHQSLYPALGHLLGTDPNTELAYWGARSTSTCLMLPCCWSLCFRVCTPGCANVYMCVLFVPSVYPSRFLEYTCGHYSGDIKDAIFMDCCMILKNE